RGPAARAPAARGRCSPRPGSGRGRPRAPWYGRRACGRSAGSARPEGRGSPHLALPGLAGDAGPPAAFSRGGQGGVSPPSKEEAVRRLRLVLPALLLATLIATIPARASSAPRYSTAGRWIVDGEGRRLLLRGLDVMGAEFTPTTTPLPYGPSDFAAMRAMGATVVRLPIPWSWVEPQRGRYDQAALQRAHDIVAWAGQAGLLVVLDMHQWHWSPCFGGNGMPEWATNPCPHTTPSPTSA